MNEELPAEIQAEIDRIAEEGNRLLEARDPRGALAAFRRGLQALPEPRERWSATLWFLSSIGDAQWFMGDHHEGLSTWRDALLHGGIGNPFVHLRRGQTLLEVGQRDEATSCCARCCWGESASSPGRILVTSRSSPRSRGHPRGWRAGGGGRVSSPRHRGSSGWRIRISISSSPGVAPRQLAGRRADG